MDVAGVVEAVGADVTRFAPGDEVIAMPGAKFGGHAEYARVRQDGVIALKPGARRSRTP
jgi:NADPH:quinone reductase-like Zn-dependent oxidoreductase